MRFDTLIAIIYFLFWFYLAQPILQFLWEKSNIPFSSYPTNTDLMRVSAMMDILPNVVKPKQKCVFFCLIKPVESIIAGYRLFTFNCWNSGQHFHNEFKIFSANTSSITLHCLFRDNRYSRHKCINFKWFWHSACVITSASMAISLSRECFTFKHRINSMRWIDHTLDEYNKCEIIKFGFKEPQKLRFPYKIAITVLIMMMVAAVLVFMANVLFVGIDIL